MKTDIPFFPFSVSRFFFSLLIISALFPLSSLAAGEEDSLPSRKAVEKLLQDLDTSSAESETRNVLRETYQKIISVLQEKDALADQVSQMGLQAQNAPKEIERLKALISGGLTGVSPNISSGTPISVLEQNLDRAKAELAASREKLASETDLAEVMINRRKDLPRIIADVRQRSESFEENLKTIVSTETDRDKARSWLCSAQLLRADTEIKALELEMANFEQFMELGKLRKESLSIKIAAGEIQVDSFRRLVDLRRRREAEAAASRARETVRDLSSEFPFLIYLGEENASWAEQRRLVSVHLEDVSRVSASYSQVLTRIQEEHRAVRDRIQAIGFSDAMGILLRVKRVELPSMAGYQEATEERKREISSTQLRLIEVEEILASMRNLDTVVSDLLAGKLDGVSTERRRALEEKVRAVLQQRRDFLEALQRDLSNYFSRLIDLDNLGRQLAKKALEFRDYIDERILWVRNCQPLGLSDIPKIFRGLTWFFAPGNWISVVSAFWRGFWVHPLLVIILLSVFGGLLSSRSRFNERLKEISNLVRSSTTDHFGLTLEAVAITAVWSAPWPFFFFVSSLVLGSAPSGGEFSWELANLLADLAIPVWGLEFLRCVFYSGGIAESHFHFPISEVHSVIQRKVRMIGWSVIPMALIFSMVQDLAPDQVKITLGRALFILILLLTAGLMAPLTRPSGPVIRALEMSSPESLILRLRYPVFFLAVVFPLAMVAASWLGFFYTARQLFAKAVLSLILVLSGLFVHSLIRRFLNVHRRNLTLRRSQIGRAVPEIPANAAGMISPEHQASIIGVEPSIVAISAQTEKLLLLALAVFLVVGLFHVWAEVFPALRIFDQVKLWSITTRVDSTVVPADGSAKNDLVEKVVNITLFDLIVAVALIFLTVTASRNLPGFLEFLLLQRLELDAGLKFAIRALSSYLIILLGSIFVFERIGLGWDRIQWLAAGVSVGLGFGLQEIFANFVSGLIILFERPIRVGDTVTVGEETGTVTRIQIRATTLLNFDRKEVIIPNKTLITGSMTNWTLTDSVQRLVFKIGVGYGSDPEKVRNILFVAAKNNPRVLSDPPPQALLTGFGDSALNFELRVFIGSLDLYSSLQHEINCHLLASLTEAGIEIPFPQQEIRLKNDTPRN